VGKKRARLQAQIDLDEVIFEGDRSLRKSLLSQPEFRDAVRGAHARRRVGSARRDLLVSSLRLDEAIAPGVIRACRRARDTLALDAEIEAFCLPEPRINAFIAPPDGGPVLLGFSSGALEGLDEDEMAFVVGHEIGHALFDHFALTPSVLFDLHQDVPPAQMARLYAWMRYAELSADRVGLLCCRHVDVAVRAFFKLTSGLCDARFIENATQAAAQLTALSTDQMDSSEEDWFSTHPYGPLRIKAIDLFATSARYHSLVGRVGSSLDDREVDRQIATIMRLMDPTFLWRDAEHAHEVQLFVALGGAQVALADGTIDDSEIEVLSRIAGHGLLDGGADALEGDDGGDDRLAELGKFLALRLPIGRRRRIIEDLASVALADRELHEAELRSLRRSAKLLKVDPSFVAEAIARVQIALD
jgi:uncharacterized tellurite resistance protein B-like protein